MIPYTWLNEAFERIKAHIRHTPLTYDPLNDLYLKWENHQVTGSFKLRGALNKVLSLQSWELERGLVTASAGNHGQGVALAGNLASARVTVFCSEHAVTNKIEAIRQFGAEVKLVPGGYGEAEQAAIEFARSSEATWISPYNDGQVIAGQGTLGLETHQELSPSENAVWIVPAGGGGLVSGIGVALEMCNPKHRLVAVQSEASPFLYAIYHHGSQAKVVEAPSLADGLAGPVEEGSLTIPLVKRLVSNFILVSEEDIAHAMAYSWQHYGEMIEGSAAAALAAALTGKMDSRPAVVILSGGNIQPDIHAEVIKRCQTMAEG